MGSVRLVGSLLPVALHGYANEETAHEAPRLASTGAQMAQAWQTRSTGWFSQGGAVGPFKGFYSSYRVPLTNVRCLSGLRMSTCQGHNRP
jgi:hypothetical protein